MVGSFLVRSGSKWPSAAARILEYLIFHFYRQRFEFARACCSSFWLSSFGDPGRAQCKSLREAGRKMNTSVQKFPPAPSLSLDLLAGNPASCSRRLAICLSVCLSDAEAELQKCVKLRSFVRRPDDDFRPGPPSHPGRNLIPLLPSCANFAPSLPSSRTKLISGKNLGSNCIRRIRRASSSKV